MRKNYVYMCVCQTALSPHSSVLEDIDNEIYYPTLSVFSIFSLFFSIIPYVTEMRGKSAT